MSLLTREPEPIFSAQLEDVTQEAAALEKERLAVVRLRELDHAKDELVTTVSHELRTPLTSIVGYTELLQDRQPTPEQQRLLGSIERNGQTTARPVRRPPRAGRPPVRTTPTSCARASTSTWSWPTRWTRWPRSPPIEASSSPGCRPPGPMLVVGDPTQLERVLLNLLGNAVKFTEDGGSVECGVEVHDDEVWVHVSDTGIGIPAAEQPAMFQPFFRSSTSRRRGIQGTGLGSLDRRRHRRGSRRADRRTLRASGGYDDHRAAEARRRRSGRLGRVGGASTTHSVVLGLLTRRPGAGWLDDMTTTDERPPDGRQ